MLLFCRSNSHPTMGRKRKTISEQFIDLGMVDRRHRVQCRECQSTFEANRTETHQCKNIVADPLYDNITDNKCPLCNGTFSNNSNVRKHLRQKKCSKYTAPALHKDNIDQAGNHDDEDAKVKPSPKRVYIIIDTNILISSLETVESLLAIGIFYQKYFCFSFLIT